jgi:hypothetical protein
MRASPRYEPAAREGRVLGEPSASSGGVVGHAYLAELAVAVERNVTTHCLDHTIASKPGDDSRGQSTPPAGTFASVKTGGLHSCGRRTDDTVACWGDNVYGQSSPPAGTFKLVSTGGNHTCGLQSDDTVPCWGDDSYGQLG